MKTRVGIPGWILPGAAEVCRFFLHLVLFVLTWVHFSALGGDFNSEAVIQVKAALLSSVYLMAGS